MDKTILTVRIKSDGYYETAFFKSTEEETLGAVFTTIISAISRFKNLGTDKDVIFCMLEDILERKEEFIELSEEIG